MGEIQAIKTEVVEAIKRRLQNDGRAPADLYSVATVAIAEVVADMTFAAARDREHAHNLLNIIVAQVEGRWRELAAST